jgi:gliding motility-associated lipoprotein GldB
MKEESQHQFNKNMHKSPVSLSFDTPFKKGGFSRYSFGLHKVTYALYTLFFIILIFFSSCNRNPLKVDISGIETEVEVVRFDQELFDLPMQDTLAELSALRNKYPDFFDLFTWKVIGVGGIEEEHFPKIMGEFLTDTMILNVKMLVEKEFSNFEKTEEDLVEAFKYFQYHFPEKELPTVFTTISGFNQSVFTAEGLIGVSLDKYLGRECSYYKQLSNVPLYKIKNMHPEKLVSDVAYAWGMTEFDELGSATTVLDHIVHQGKLMYFVDALLPEMHDSLKIGYTAEQLQWCKNNEPQMWNFLVEKKMLYSNKRMDIMRFINDGPYTTGFPTESPGKSGVWIGWQIVRQYMKKHKEVTVSELMKNTNYQQILNDSGYYPE